MTDDTDGRREAGRVAAALESIDRRLGAIERRLDGFQQWQLDVAARLAAGAEKFSQLERRDTESAVKGGGIGGAVGTFAAVVAWLFSRGQ